MLKGVRVQSIEEQGRYYRMKTADDRVIKAEFIVLAVPYTQAQHMYSDDRLSELFAVFRAGSLISVYLGYDIADHVLPQDGTGFIKANGDDLYSLQCLHMDKPQMDAHFSGSPAALAHVLQSTSPQFAKLRHMSEEELLRTAREI